MLITKGEKRKFIGKNESKAKRVVLKTLWMDHCIV